MRPCRLKCVRHELQPKIVLFALRLTLLGRGPLHHAIVSNRESFRGQLSASIGEASSDMAWLEKVRIKVTAPLDLARLAERDDPIGLLIRTLESLEADQATLKELAKSVLTELEPKASCGIARG